MSNTTAWLIRHGQSTSNLGAWSRQPNDILLTAEGKNQALVIANQIIARPDLIISSPMQRALQTAAPTMHKWSDVPMEIWPIQEFTYLSPTKYHNKTAIERKTAVLNYWQQAIPSYCDGEDCESFANFVNRLNIFHQALLNNNGFLVIFGHGQFFKAFLLGHQHGFLATSEWMTLFRQQETTHPLSNGEIIKWHHYGASS